MDSRIMNYIPASKKDAIRDAYRDEDGYWICLREGWEASRTDRECRTIHEDKISDLKYQIAGIQRIAAEEPESAEPATEATSEGSAPTGEENAAESVSEGRMEMSTPGLNVSLPLDGFTDAALNNLLKMVNAKASLIGKALGTDNLDILADTKSMTVSFPWWDRLPSPEETQAYMAFIAAICKAAKDAKRVNAKEREVESERYAFRSFLLRLGFIGPGCAAQRKILLSRLSGSASFPSSEKYTAFCASQKEKRDAAKEVS